MIQLTQQEARLVLEALETSTDEGVPEPFKVLQARIAQQLSLAVPAPVQDLKAA